jgi:endonuclease YncB( thermonuclease family)
MIARARTVRALVLAATAVVGALLLGGCVPTEVPRAVSAPSTPAGSTAVADDASTATEGSTTTVSRVIDGDTFVITGGVEVRVLGIDSCEAGTPGGTRATQAARAALLGRSVRLTSQPGVDLDRYGRELRYISTADGDFAEMMVRADHTAIYSKGHNDASPAVQARLRSLDGNGRTCGTPGADTTTATRRPPAVGTPKPAPKPRPAGAAPAPAVGGASYANCTAARAAGVTPLHRGEPGYSAKLDRDGDGVACE